MAYLTHVVRRKLENKSLALSPLFVQPMHANYYKTVKQWKSFKIIIMINYNKTFHFLTIL